MDLLRFITAGSVDDGKSTLIGRLLYDSKSILQDQLETIAKQTKNKANGEIDLAILTDGLRAEREQGITIDVAYKYFSTPKRKFIIADAPGHIQYTRNMITGASNCDLIIILIDARQGVIEQTKRHSLIASMLGIKNIVVAINKMDLVNYSQNQFDTIVTEYHELVTKLNLPKPYFIPVSALTGENIVENSTNLNWFTGKTLLTYLEEINVETEIVNKNRFQVQYVIRPQTTELHDYRGYAGLVRSGNYKKGNEITILPQNVKSKLIKIEKDGKEVNEANEGESIIFHLADDIDISRGETFATTENLPTVTNEISAFINWMDNKPLVVGNKYLLQHNSKVVKAVIKSIDYKLNINTLEQENSNDSAQLNDVCKIQLKTASPIVIDSYSELKQNGSAILIDETSFVTVGALTFL